MLNELRRLFYPHSSNNHKAGILQPSGLCVLIALFLLSQSFLNLFFNFAPGVLGFASSITPEEIVELTNQKRTGNGIAPLKINGQLNEAAQQKAADMFALNYWSHVSPRGLHPWSFISNAGYYYLYAGENLARDFYNAGGVVEAWMNSSTHRDNILNKKYQDIGVAVVDGVLQDQETTLVVQMLGTPQGRPATVPQEAVLQEKPPVVSQEATEEATIQPTPELEKIEGTPGAILIKSMPEEKGTSSFSGFDLTKSLTFAFAGLLFAVLAFDGIIIWRKKKARIAGHNFIHGTFVIILIIMILLSQRGVIL